MTLGGADRVSAALDALSGGFNGWTQRYNANLQQEQARDRYDWAHRQIAASLGALGGGALSLFTFGPGEAAAAAMPRLAGAAKLTAKEAAGVVGAGGLAGLGSQTLSDIATNHRPSPADAVGAVFGGMAGGAALPFVGPSGSGAVDGAVTSAAQSLFSGQPISVPETAQSAAAGALFGGVTGRVGRNWSDSLSSKEKGRLGEDLGAIRSEFAGPPRLPGPKVRAPLAPEQAGPLKGKGTYWVPDGRGGPFPTKPGDPWPDLFEDKFGYEADTSTNQKIAQKNFDQKFRLNHFTPSDVGMMTAFPFLTTAPQVVRRDQAR